MAEDPGADRLDMEILDAFGELFQQVTDHAEKISQRFGLPAFAAKALHLLDTSMAMKELGKAMHCDPSFITGVADVLEKHGLAQRKPGAPDRRVKNLELTPEGLDMKQHLETDFLANLPWRGVLDDEERCCLLRLIRKLNSASKTGAAAQAPKHGGREDVTAAQATGSYLQGGDGHRG
jgi:DNA-binding MarR family transcriptional regulator